MMKNAIRELKVWSVFMTAGVSVLATEVAVKTQRPGEADSPRSLLAASVEPKS